MDPAFENAGTESGLLIWRIEDFQPVPYPKEKYGQFHKGDSYILLNTVENRGGNFTHDIHFWLGSETSQDEAGTAAIKSVELDDQLGGTPVQHREVEGHESALFLSRFKKGVRYLNGGVASGFTHVDPDAPYEARMFKVKGRRNVRVTQVEVGFSSMNKEDCFILDAGEVVYVYCGPSSRRMERMKAIFTANSVRDEDHAGSAKVAIIDEHADGGDVEGFLEAMGGGSLQDVPDKEEDDDDEHERTQEKVVSLNVIWADGDDIGTELVANPPLNQEMLNSESASEEKCFLLDTGGNGVFIWIGREATKELRGQAMQMGSKYLSKQGYPAWTKVERIVDRGEPTIFKQYFASWTESEDQIGLGRVFTTEQIAASIPDVPFDPSSLHDRKLLKKNAGHAFGFLPDDGSGTVEIMRVENFELEPVDESIHGFFFGGDSYVIKYTYELGGSENYIIYFWQGAASSQDEKASSAIHAVRLDNELSGKAIQVRVVQGCEPEHFLRIFKGRMVVFMGGKASGFRNVHDHDTYDADGTRLFQVKGLCDFDTRAIQKPEEASSLNSDDVFVLESPAGTFVWVGAGSSEQEKTFGEKLAGVVSPGSDVTVMAEGEETDDFWNALGGQGDYAKQRNVDKPNLAARLFHCSISPAGRLRVREVADFTQEDLAEDDIMILDSGDEVYVWIGKDSSEEEKEKGLFIAKEYVATDPTTRSLDNCVIARINQGSEPTSFKDVFPSWNSSYWA